jgi:hypothetical protein
LTTPTLITTTMPQRKHQPDAHLTGKTSAPQKPAAFISPRAAEKCDTCFASLLHRHAQMSFHPHKHRVFAETANEVCGAKEIYRKKRVWRDFKAAGRAALSGRNFALIA